MTTRTKTTVTITFSFISNDEKCSINSLLNWMSEFQDDKPVVVRNCESGEYTITNKRSISDSFTFKTVAELARKYGTYFSIYDLGRAMLDYCKSESVTATSEDIEVEDK